jgi:purine-nucleoside phosphorylase
VDDGLGRGTADPFDQATRAALTLRATLGAHRIAVVAGSGWAGAAERLGRERASVPLAELPGWPVPTVEGHGTRASSVEVDGVGPVLVLGGRSHLYEGLDAATVVHPVRSAVLAGCTIVVLTNAAGSLRVEWPVGTPVLLADQLNLSGGNPLAGPGPFPTARPRFCDLGDLFDRDLRERIRSELPGLPEGVYAGVLGGSFETPAEIRMLDRLGADLVGMSTVLESIAAHHLGARVVGLSLVTNPAAGLTESIDHDAVLAAAGAAVPRLIEVLGSALRAATPVL